MSASVRVRPRPSASVRVRPRPSASVRVRRIHKAHWKVLMSAYHLPHNNGKCWCQHIIYHTTMESADVSISFTTQQWKALCIRRTRTDADGRGRTRTFFLFFIFLACIDLRAQLEQDPESDRLGHPPPPPTHHDPMKIYRVYRYLHAQKYTLFVDLHV